MDQNKGLLERARSGALTTLIVVSAANLLNYFDRSIFNVVLEPIRKEFSLNNTQIGFLAGAFALMFAVMSLPLAASADRFRRLTIVGVSIALWSVATAACGVARSFVQLFVARVGVGIGEAGCLPAGTSLIADHYPPAKRAAAISVYQGSGLVGSTLGLIIIGMLADTVGWRLALIYASLPGLLLAPIALLLREPKRGRFDAPGAAQEPWLRSLGFLLRSPVYILLLTAITCVSLGFVAIGTWGPTFFARSFGLSLSKIGLFFGLSFGLGAALGTFIGGYCTSLLVARNSLWEFWSPAIAFALAIPLFQLAMSAPTAPLAFAGVGLACFVAFLGYGPTMSLYHVVAPPAVRATAVSVGAFLAGIVGSFAGPVAVGALTDVLTPAFGAEALRTALAVFMLIFIVPASLYTVAGRMILKQRRAAAGAAAA